METLGKNICQRCRKSIHRLADFGSYLDGTINTEYCHNCYSHGVLVNNEIMLVSKIDNSMATP